MNYFDLDLFDMYLELFVTGVSSGFVIGFISWGLGFAIYSIIKWVRYA